MNYSTLNTNTFRKNHTLTNYEKDTLIFKLSNDLEKMNRQVILLTQKNRDLNKLLSDYRHLKNKLVKCEYDLKKKDEEKIDIIKEKDDKNSKLFNKISFLENTVSINRINYEKNNILYQQKMSAFNHIQKENQIYAEEKANFEKEKQLYEKKKDDEVDRYKIRSQLKYEKFKQKMDEDLKILNETLVDANSKYISANHRLVILQNKELYYTIEGLEKRIYELEKENHNLRRGIFESKNDLNMEKLVGKDLVRKMEDNKKVIRLTRNKSMLNSISLDNKEDSELNIKTNTFKNNEYNGQIQNTYTMRINNSQSFQRKISEYKKIIDEKKYENEQMVLTNTHLRTKLNSYQNKFNGLFNFLEESLNNFCNDEEIINNNNFYMNLDKIKNCDFNSFSKQEKYSLLVLLMKYLLPLISINFNSSSNIGKDLFKTNLNIVNKKFNLNETFLKDETLRNAFLDKRNKVYQDISNPRRTQFSSSVPVLKKLKESNFNIFENKNKAII
jgi:hypothetical protein